jgi:adenosylcobinamide kinase/adenosylcobinamide-phosphate guanylyltransferase
MTLITGGARSGKSAFALSLARRQYKNRAFVATAVATDDEMRERIDRHRKERGDAFLNVEESLDLASAVARLPADIEVAVIDCLTVWLGNVYHAVGDDERKVAEHVDALVNGLTAARCDLLVVTNEVGWGIVPENALARSYRDMAGRLNRMVASKAACVYMVTCGIPQRIKGECSDA